MFNRAPKSIPIPRAEAKQFALVMIGIFFGFFTFVAVNNGSFQGFLICGGLCVVCLFSAAKIKTRYEACGQNTRYRKR